MKLQTVTNKDNIMKDMKKMMKTGGMDKFMRKEQERKSLMSTVKDAKLVTEKNHRLYKSSIIRVD
jgi:predicted AAA+ superfamily ATPase